MHRGPVEILVIEFPGSQFTGEILPELSALVASDTIAVVDGVFVQRGDDDDLLVVEFGELLAEHGDVSGVVGDVDDLLSEEDIDELATGVPAGSSAAIVAFEHRWAVGLTNAVVNSGGRLLANVRIPATVVEDVAALVEDLATD